MKSKGFALGFQMQLWFQRAKTLHSVAKKKYPLNREANAEKKYLCLKIMSVFRVPGLYNFASRLQIFKQKENHLLLPVFLA